MQYAIVIIYELYYVLILCIIYCIIVYCIVCNNYYELCTYTIDVYVYTCMLIIFMMNKLTILIQLMCNYTCTCRPLCFMMNKLTCKRMNTSVWCGESGQQQVSHCMREESNHM